MRDTPPDIRPHDRSALDVELTETSPSGRWRRWLVLCLLGIALAAGLWYYFRKSAAPVDAPAPGSNAAPVAGSAPAATAPPAATGKGGRFDPSARPMPVAAAVATRTAFAVRLAALGTVTARSTVTVRSRVDGPLNRLYFREGDSVKAGQLLAQIDPRSFEVALAQANAQLERDRAQLANARVDLERYQGLLKIDSIASQTVDNQAATVKQFEATVASDQAAVDSARLQLSYTRITAPISGRTGLRQVDAGNLVRAADSNGLVVITEVTPISVVFPLPQDQLPAVMTRMRGGAKLAVDAFDRDGRSKLATGELVTVDNVIDTTTGTVKLKAEFPNQDGALFPNQFVNVRLLVDTLNDTVVVPTAAIQRGAPGTFVYLAKDDGSVSVQPVKLGPVDADRATIVDGLRGGERVVTDGADKLRDGAKVDVIDPNAAATVRTPAQEQRRGTGKRGAANGAPADGPPPGPPPGP